MVDYFKNLWKTLVNSIVADVPEEPEVQVKKKKKTKKSEIEKIDEKLNSKRKSLTKKLKDTANNAINDIELLKENAETGKKRYMSRLINTLKKAVAAKDAEAVIVATTKITNYLEKNKG